MEKSSIYHLITVSLKKYFWPAGIVLIIHLISMTVYKVYNVWPEFDTPMHIAGGLTAAYFFSGFYLEAKKMNLIGDPADILRIISAFSATSAVTIFWEYFEFFLDTFFGTRMQASIGETLLDMLFGMLGAIICLYLFHKNSKN